MKSINSAVTEKGQVTIPREIRDRLGIRAPDRVTFVVDDSGVRLEPAKKSFVELAGAVPPMPGKEPGDFEEIIEDVMDQEAERIVGEIQR